MKPVIGFAIGFLVATVYANRDALLPRGAESTPPAMGVDCDQLNATLNQMQRRESQTYRFEVAREFWIQECVLPEDERP